MGRILMVDPWQEVAEELRRSRALADHEMDTAAGDADALQRLRARDFGLLITSPTTSVEEDLVFLDEARGVRPGFRSIVLAARAAPDSVIAALRARVFSLFTAPFRADEIARMAAGALAADDAREGIEIISARADWLEVRVNCSLVTADRLLQFVSELRSEVPGADREGLLLAFREVLQNAMEHGARLDPERVVEVAAVRTERAIVFYVRDPEAGFEVPPAPGRRGEEELVRSTKSGETARGFGLLLARTVVDEVMYSEHAHEVLLIKHTK